MQQTLRHVRVTQPWIDSVRSSQAKHHSLFPCLLQCKSFAFPRPSGPHRCVPAPVLPVKRVRCRSKPHIRKPFPICRIVHGTLSRFGPVGNLVMLVPRRLKTATDKFILHTTFIIREFLIFPPGNHGRKGASILHAQLVRRNVFGRERDKSGKRTFKLIHIHTQSPEYQVYTDIVDSAAAQYGHRFSCRIRVMTTVHTTKHHIIQ